MDLTDGVLRSPRTQIIRAAYPDTAFEGLETNPHDFGAAHGLRSAGNLAVSEIGLD